MSKKDLLLEIGLEELPARFVTSSMNQLSEKIQAWLTDNQILFGEVKAYSTPRRLAIFVKDVAEKQEDIHEEAKGPARKIAVTEDGEWTKAAIGFTRGQQMSVEDIYFKEMNGVEYAHVKKFIKGQETKQLLEQLKDIVTGLTFPKNMRWGNEDLRYIRPIKWIVALFGQERIPFKITHVETGNWSMGHRFLGEKTEITAPAVYEEQLLAQHVLADPVKRKAAIVSQLEKIEEENNWVIPIDEDLLEEVTNLVEYPTALYGKFEEAFLEIPEEVLITSMKEHQRYFPVKSKENQLLPYFVAVRNGDHKHLEKVAKGNEKVLRARLADAAFFYREDQKTSIEDSLKKLNKIVYHEEIGTLSEKVTRVRRLTNVLADELQFSTEEKTAADRTAEISKFDLVSHMVYEFPELQGFMGEKYALQKGENELVSKAINEQYMPRNAEDDTPQSNVGAAIAIAEKLDTIASCFAIGIIPSGSQDPYALRRQATGIVQTLLNKKWRLSLESLINQSLDFVIEAGIQKKEKVKLQRDLVNFFKLRIKYLLQERGVRYDLIDAVLGGDIGEISALMSKAEVLDMKKNDLEFKENMEALSRILNIASKAEVEGEVEVTRFENEHEKELYQKYLDVREQLSKDVTEEEYFTLLVSLKPQIDRYFEHTMVMAEDAKVRENRLNQMLKLASLVKKFANINEVIVK
jgi:glycyl-tRNA synthetase beta chain